MNVVVAAPRTRSTQLDGQRTTFKSRVGFTVLVVHRLIQQHQMMQPHQEREAILIGDMLQASQSAIQMNKLKAWAHLPAHALGLLCHLPKEDIKFRKEPIPQIDRHAITHGAPRPLT